MLWFFSSWWFFEQCSQRFLAILCYADEGKMEIKEQAWRIRGKLSYGISHDSPSQQESDNPQQAVMRKSERYASA